jgi:hypothetical protein
MMDSSIDDKEVTYEEECRISINDSHQSLKSRTYLSLQHIQSAAFFTRSAFEIEKNYNGVYCEDLYFQHRAYVIGAVLSSVCFLESCINELFCDSHDYLHDGNINEQLNNTELMATMWELGIPKTASFDITRKYQVALALNSKQLFDPGGQPFQDANLLVRLRNALIHYEPHWIKFPISDDYTPNDYHKFQKQLEGKFVENRLTGAGNPFYPDKCLGWGCADWSVQTSLRFSKEFFSRIEIAVPYDHIRHRLNTK